MALNVKVGLIGPLDMLKFKNMAKNRDKVIEAAPAKEISGEYAINNNAKALHPDHMDLVVADVISHAENGAKTFVFASKDGKPLPYFRAGQYLSLKLKIGDSFVTRPYSISSSPKLALLGKMEVTVCPNPSGFAADWLLDNLKKGDEVVTSAPDGTFYYEPLRDCKDVIALAGGSGVTPFLSMAEAISDGIEDFNLTIIYGSRTVENTLFKAELDKICADCPKVKAVYVFSDENVDGYENGFITADIIKKYSSSQGYSVFVCGPSAMYAFVSKEIEKLQIPHRFVRYELLGVTKNVKCEKGYPADCAGNIFNVTVHQGPNTYKITASADEPLLVSLERAGIKAPSRCRSGQCGWCRSKLVSGNVFVLEENEGRRYSDIVNNYIHPCACFALSDIVIEVPGEYL